MELDQFYQKLLPKAGKDLIEEAVAVSRVRVFPAGTPLVTRGSAPTCLHFLLHGVIRGYVIDADGREITDCLACRCGEPLMADNDFHQQASVTMEALEDATVVEVPLEQVERMLAKYPELWEVYEQLVVWSADLHRQLKMLLYQYSAAQRYRWFLDNYPGVIDRIPHRYVASYLNMTPVTLSKMRHQLRQQDPEG